MPTAALKATAMTMVMGVMTGVLAVGLMFSSKLDEGVGGDDAQGGAKQGDDDALDEDLDENGQAGGANGFADADLADALVDAGQHDIHDADASRQ